MEKKKRDDVAAPMRERLFANRNGRMLPAQWIDIATEPMVYTLILLMMALPVFGARMYALLRASWWIVLLSIVVLIAIPVLTRAFRYARTPIHFKRLYGTDRAGMWTIWRPVELETLDKTPVRFPRRLSPRPKLIPNREYLVYYLEDSHGRVLLSCAPADHEDAELWTPTKHFDERYFRRTGSIRRSDSHS